MSQPVIAADEENFVAGLRSLLESKGHRVVSACKDANKSLAVAEFSHPEIVILSQSSSPAGSLVETITRLQGLGKKVVLLLERPADACEVANLNVDGIVVSNPQIRQFLECIESIEAGRHWVDPDVLSFILKPQRTDQDYSLTARERQIVEGLVRGLRNKHIARELRVHESTVKMHLHHIYTKLHLGGRRQLVLSTAAASVLMGESGNPDRRHGNWHLSTAGRLAFQAASSQTAVGLSPLRILPMQPGSSPAAGAAEIGPVQSDW